MTRKGRVKMERLFDRGCYSYIQYILTKTGNRKKKKKKNPTKYLKGLSS